MSSAIVSQSVSCGNHPNGRADATAPPVAALARSRNSTGSCRLSAILWVVASSSALLLAASAQAQFPNLPSRPDRPPAKDPAKERGTQPGKGAPAQPKRLTDSQQDLWEPGDEVVPPKPLPAGREPAPSKAPASPDRGSATTGGPAWGVLIASFTQPDHRQVALAMRDRLATSFPQLRDAYVQRVSDGSVILVGRFPGPDDPAAQAMLREVKGIQSEGRRPFSGAMLIRTATSSGPPGPFDVRRLREQFPNVSPLYSLQVAAWSTFGDRQTDPASIRAAAEAHCRELRARGFEAWVHHDEATATSVVTVGHFDHTAYDPRSTLYAPEVEALMKRFPRHLVNGEELLIPVDPRRPDGPKRPQGCRLVEIPK